MTIPDLSQYQEPQAGPLIPDLSQFRVTPEQEARSLLDSFRRESLVAPAVSTAAAPTEPVDRLDEILSTIGDVRREAAGEDRFVSEAEIQERVRAALSGEPVRRFAEERPGTLEVLAAGVEEIGRKLAPTIPVAYPITQVSAVGLRGAQRIVPVGGGVDIAAHAFANPVETLQAIVTAPFIISYNQYRELMTESAVPASIMAALVRMGIEDPEDILGHGATIDDATTENVRQVFRERLGDMTPREAREARRAFSALVLSLAVAPAGAAAGLRLGTALRLSPIGTRVLAGQTAAISAGATLGFVEAEPEDRFKMAIGYGLIAAPFGLAHATFGPVLGEIRGRSRGIRVADQAAADAAHIRMVRALDEVPDAIVNLGRELIPERPEPVLGDAVQRAARLAEEGRPGEAARVMQEAIRVRESGLPVEVAGAEAIVVTRAFRRFGQEFSERVSETLQTEGIRRGTPDEARIMTEVAEQMLREQEARVAGEVERLQAEGRPEEAARVFREAFEEVREAEARPRLELIRNNEGVRDYTEAQINQAEKGSVPTQAEGQVAATVTNNLIRSNLNTLRAIIETHKAVKPNEVTIIPGANSPAEVIRLANELLPQAHILSVFKRPDGLYDIAIGGRQSALKGSQSQFANQGFYENEPIFLEGKAYLYRSKQGDLAILKEPGSDRIVRADFSRIRRAPYVSETPIRDVPVETVLKELKEVLADEPGTYEAIRRMYNEMNPPAESGREVPTPPVEVVAASNNMIVRRGAPGTWKVVDGTTGRILMRGLRSETEARKYINDTMQEIGSEAIGSDNAPPDVPINTINDMIGPPNGDIPGPPGAYGVPFTAAPKWRLVDSWRIAIDERFRRVTGRRDNFAAMDDRFPGLQSMPEAWAPLQDGLNRARGSINPLLQRVKNQLDPLIRDLSAERRELIIDAKETFSARELRKMVRPEEVDFAERLSSLGIDLERVYRFRRELRELVTEVARQQDIPIDEFPIEVRNTLREQLIERSRFTAAEIEADRIFTQVISRDLSEVSLYNVTRLHDAIVDNAMSRQEFFDFHRFTGKERRAVQTLDDLYKSVADILEIPDERLIPGYVSHARRYGSVDPNTAFEQRAPTGSRFELAQNMTAEMIRSGEITDYVRDPISNFLHYANSSINFKFVVSRWNDVANLFNRRIRALETDRFGNPVTEVDRLRIRQNVDDYLNDIRGFRDESFKALNGYIEEFARGIGLKITPDERTNFSNLYLATTSSAAMAFRPGMGFRDFIDYFIRSGSRFGFKPAAEYLGKVNPMLESGRRIIEDMRARGIFNQLHHIEFAVPGEVQRMRAGPFVQRTASRFAEAGLRGSLQPQLHEMTQAAMYLLMRDRAAPMVNELVRSGDNALPIERGNAKYRAYARNKIFTFTDSPINHFDNLVRQGKTQEAVDFISKLAAHEVAYDYGSGNGPFESRRPFNRMALQFGTWSMNTRSFFLRGISRGTLADRYGFAARFALTQAALFQTGLATGLNMSRFYMIPGIVFSGGPLIQYLTYAANMASGSEWDQERAAWAFTRLIPNFREGDVRTLLLPVSYAAYDMAKAFELAREGEDIFISGGRALAIPAQRDKPNWWEMYLPGAGAIREAIENR